MTTTRPDPEDEQTDEQSFEVDLLDLLEGSTRDDEFDVGIEHVTSFAAAGVLTRNAGLVVRLRSGDEFQITIVQSRRSDR